MATNVGEMFYTGPKRSPLPGRELEQPATLDEALTAGGLRWRVGESEIRTAEDPPSPCPRRKAIVRLDRPTGAGGRVLGVVHRDFKALQNEQGAQLFDAIFGQSKAVYHTGGYLGNGEVIWLLAKIDRSIEVAPNDPVEPYALFVNSHDGSYAVHIRLTTVRVVCRNSLELALSNTEFGEPFSRAHQGSLRAHAAAASEFFAASVDAIAQHAKRFEALTQSRLDDSAARQLVATLLPTPRAPRGADPKSAIARAHQAKVQRVLDSRAHILRLRTDGVGMEIDAARGTYWGLLNAVTEFVDHHRGVDETRMISAMFGAGRDLKLRAFREIEKAAFAA